METFNEPTRPLVVVQSNGVAAMTAPLAEATRARNIALHDISFADGVKDPVAPSYKSFCPIFIYGSIALLHHWARFHPDLAQWVFWDEEPLSPVTWAREFGPRFLNAGGCRMTPAQFSSLTGLEWHVRPIENTKRVIGGLYRPCDFAELDLSPSLGLWVAARQEIAAEVRVFFVGKRIAAASLYRFDGEHLRSTDHPLLDGALDAAQRFAGIYLPHPHTVMDLALLPSGEWKLIEFNSINSCGWYACDPGTVLDRFVEHFRG